MQDINREKLSWDAGGYRYQQKETQDAYNKQMAELGQSDFDWRISDAAPTGLDYLNNILGSAFGMGSAALGFGGSLQGAINAGKSQNKKNSGNNSGTNSYTSIGGR
jgi:hypothetical protein